MVEILCNRFFDVAKLMPHKENLTQFSIKSDEEGFLVAYPGLFVSSFIYEVEGLSNSFNAGTCCGPAMQTVHAPTKILLFRRTLMMLDLLLR